MYQDLLASVCEVEEQRRRTTGVDELLAELERRHRQLTAGHRSSGSGDVVGELALQLSYDAVLVVLGRRAGIDTGPDAFAVPSSERGRLEHLLGQSS